jgi:hypothetical protein
VVFCAALLLNQAFLVDRRCLNAFRAHGLAQILSFVKSRASQSAEAEGKRKGPLWTLTWFLPTLF